MGNIDIEVTRKRVKGIRLRTAQDGSFKLSAPLFSTAAEIELFILANRDWIMRTRQRVALSCAHIDCRDGGSIMVWGERRTIRVERTEKRSKAAYVQGNELVVPLSPAKLSAEGIEAACHALLASEVKKRLADHAVPRMEAHVGAHASAWRVRTMTSRWGSCNTGTHVITINARLAHFPPHCLDYVVCHELCHLLEPSHNARFHALMDRFYPGWKAVRKELSG